MCYFGLWYWLNIQFNIINKQIYNYFPFPWFVSAVHLAVGLLIMTFFWTTRLVKYEKPDKEFLKAVTLPSFLHAFGHCLTNVSFAAVAVSLTHTIKTLEPVFSAAGSFLVSGTVYALPVYLALLPIIGGVALASATDLSFSWLGFSTAMASNVAFSARAIFSKKLMARMSPLNLYNFVTIVSLLFCIPFVVMFEGSALAAGIQKAIEIKGQKEFTIALLKVGAFYHLYNQVAYQALGKVEPVTHAVGNVGKRIFVIGFTILAFGTKISTQTATPLWYPVVGAGLYGWLKAKYAADTKDGQERLNSARVTGQVLASERATGALDVLEQLPSSRQGCWVLGRRTPGGGERPRGAAVDWGLCFFSEEAEAVAFRGDEWLNAFVARAPVEKCGDHEACRRCGLLS